MQCLFDIFLINILFCNFLLVQDWPIERNLQQCMKNSAEKKPLMEGKAQFMSH